LLYVINKILTFIPYSQPVLHCWTIAFYKFMYFINVLFLATLVVTLMC
jgi:hypothetical protein